MKMRSQFHAPQPLYLHRRFPAIHFTVDWADPMASFETVVNRKILAPAGNQTPVI
jgi:hypothetical protein